MILDTDTRLLGHSVDAGPTRLEGALTGPASSRDSLCPAGWSNFTFGDGGGNNSRALLPEWVRALPPAASVPKIWWA
jgi:hypothetical protein